MQQMTAGDTRQRETTWEQMRPVLLLSGAVMVLWIVSNLINAAGPAILRQEDGTEIMMRYPGKLQAGAQKTLFWLVTTPICVAWIRYLFSVRGRTRAVATHLIAAALYIAFSTLVHMEVSQVHWGRTLSFMHYLGTRSGDGWMTYARILPESALFYFMAWAAVALMYAIERERARTRQAAEAEMHAARLESQLAASRLATLRAQLQPHFLFNTLNGISALTESNPADARLMLEQLSNLLRRALENEHDQIPLSQELDWVEAYLELQQKRFGDRINIEISVDPEAIPAYVPNLLLQPLVENALEHGFAGHAGACDLLVAATRVNGSLHLVVRDSGRGLSAPAQSQARTGIGLGNTQERLATIFGPYATLTLQPHPAGGTEATIILPFHTTRQ